MVNLGGTQKVDFLGACFGGEGLGLNSWAMIGVHDIWEVPKKSTFWVPVLVVLGWV